MDEFFAAAAAAAERCKSRAYLCSGAAYFSPMLLMLLVLVLPAAGSLANDSRQNINAPTWATNSPLLISPSPNEYLDLYRYACANYTPPGVSRQEIIAQYKGVPSERLRQLATKWNPSRECRREETAWRYNYYDELDSVLVRERSIDARAANVLYLSRQVKGLSIDFFTYNWGDPQVDMDNMRRVAGPKVDDERCGLELRSMLELVADLSLRVDAIRRRRRRRRQTTQMTGDDIWNISVQTENITVLTDSHISLAKILDSYGRYDSGLLFGKLFAPGSYQQCIWNKLILSADNKLAMRFCWAHLDTRKHLDVSLRKRKRTRFETNVDVLLSGICIPESCHSKSFVKYKREFQELINTQFKLPSSMYVDEHMEMSSMYCLVDEGSEFTIPLAGKLLMCSLVAWCLVVFVVSLWNTITKRSAQTISFMRERKMHKETILDHLDLSNSWHEFMDNQKANTGHQLRAGVQLDTLNVVKVLGCAFVVLGHTMALYLAHSMDDVRMTKYIESQPAVTLILAGTMVVDTFFVITGILWSYLMLKRINKRAPARQDSAPRQMEKCEPATNVDLNNNNNNNNNNSLNLSSNNLAAGQQQVNNTCFGLDAKQVVPVPAGLGERETILMAGTPPSVALVNESKCAHLSRQTRKHTHTRASFPTRTFLTTWLMYSCNRYLKIVPLYAMVHWFKKYVFIYSGTGPFWDHGLNQLTMSGTCHKETPLTPFTFLAAYYPISRQCIFQSWSVANDIFFALLAPPVILFINKRPRAAAYLSILSCVVIMAFAQYGLAQVPTHVDEEMRELRSYGFYRFFDVVSHFYTAPHYRIFCFLAGVWAGYFVYVHQMKLVDRQQRHRRCVSQVEESHHHHLLLEDPKPARRDNVNAESTAADYRAQEAQQVMARSTYKQVYQFEPLTQREKQPAKPLASEHIEWSWWIRGPGTWFAIGYILLLPPLFAYNDALKVYLDPIYRYTYAQFLSSMRVVWAAANAILFLRMMTDWKDTVMMRQSASRFWQISAKLNYAMLLVHLDMVNYTIESSPSLPDSFTKWGFFNLGAGVYLACIPLSIFVHVVFENPINRLIRSLLPSR